MQIFMKQVGWINHTEVEHINLLHYSKGNCKLIAESQTLLY